jgi:hypothetical protein
MKKLLSSVLLAAAVCTGCSEDHNKNLEKLGSFIQSDTAITHNLRVLCKEYPARLSGSENNKNAQIYLADEFAKMGAEVSLMEVPVPNWFGGESTVEIVSGKERIAVPSVNLGLAEGTGGKVIEERVVEIKSREELEKADVKGKIVFFNDPMKSHGDYGRAGWQRRLGPGLAAEKGAKGVIVRSLTQFNDVHPHTGSTHYSDKADKIPAIAISTVEADKLSEAIAANRRLKLAISSTAHTREGQATGDNVIAEIKGSVHPENVIMVTAHLDSWHIAEGAHDDGSGVVILMNIIRAFKQAGIQPYNTIRVMPYQDEEVGLQGIHTYAANKADAGENHLYHIEIDSGVGMPTGVGLYGDSTQIANLNTFVGTYMDLGYERPVVVRAGEVYNRFPTATDLGAVAGWFMPDNSKDYFLYHHASNDNFEVLDQQELKNCSQMMTQLVYLLDRYHK